VHDSTMRPATPEETRAALLDLGHDPATPFTVDVRDDGVVVAWLLRRSSSSQGKSRLLRWELRVTLDPSDRTYRTLQVEHPVGGDPSEVPRVWKSWDTTGPVRHRLEELGWRRPPSWFARLLGRG